MPILTKNETPAKGQKAEFELDKAALAAVTSVAADSYFGDTSNWKSVEMIFKSNPGNQRRTVKFDASQATPIASFFASDRARNIFEIEKIVINDLDGGEFRVNRSELTVAEFDINMGGPSGTAIAWQSRADYTPEPDGGATSTNIGYPGVDSIMFAQSPLDTSSDFSLVYNIFSNTWAAYVFIGYSNQAKSQYSGFYADSSFSSILVNNYPDLTGVSQPTGGVSAELKIQKVGSSVFFKINGTTIHTTPSSSLDAFIYPAVRLMQGNVNIISSSIV